MSHQKSHHGRVMHISCAKALIVVAVVVVSTVTASTCSPGHDLHPIVKLGSRASNAHLRVLLLKDLKLVGK